MSIVSRYILRALIGPFLFGALTVMFLFLLQFLYKYIDQLVGKGLSFWVIAQLIALNLAWMVVLAVPLGVLVATLMAFGNLAGSNEVTIIKSGGGSLLRMMAPVVVASGLLFAALFWFNDRVLPDANHAAKILMHDIQRTKPTFAIDKGQFSTELEGYSILARNIDSSNGSLLGVTVYDNTNVNERSVVSADSGVVAFSTNLSKLIVTLFNGEIHQADTRERDDIRIVQFSKHQIAMNARGFEFSRSGEGVFSRGDRELSIAEMEQKVVGSITTAGEAQRKVDSNITLHLAYLFQPTVPDDSAGSGIDLDSNTTAGFGQDSVERSEAAARVEKRLRLLKSTLESDLYQVNHHSLKANKFLVEIHKKYAIPAACIVFILVGCPFGVITRRGNFGISAAITLGFYVVYWASLIGGEKLADRGIISPWLGMWFANLLIGSVGILLTIRVSNESVSFGFFRRLLRRRVKS